MTLPKIILKTILASLTAVAWAIPASADTVILNSGTQHEGTLISETPDEIKFEVGKSVKQVRTFKRADIKSLVVVPPDELALPTIRSLIPSPDLLDEGDYTTLINGAPSNFLRAFPTSKHKPEVEKIIATLKDEIGKVRDGSVKIDGAWITREQIAADPFNHEGRVALASLNQLIADGELLNSLRAFDALEQKYSETSSYPAAVAAVKPILAKQATVLATQFAKTARDNKKRELGYSRMGEEERKKSEAALAQELAPFLKRHAEDKTAKKKWLDFHTFDLASVADAQTEVKDEQARLDKLDVATLTARVNAISDAANLAADGKFIEADAALKSIGKIAAGSRAEEIQKQIASSLKAAQEKAAEARKIAEAAERTKAREAAEATAKAKEANTTKPIPAPKEKVVEKPKPKPKPKPPVKTASADSESYESNDLTEEDGIEFDRTGGENNESSGGGLSLLTIIMILIPVMAIVTFFSLRAAKNNVVEDFVPEETEEEEAPEQEKGVLDDYDNTPLI